MSQNGSDVNMTMYNNSYAGNTTTVASVVALGNKTLGATKIYVSDPVTEFWEYVFFIFFLNFL